MTIPVLPLDRYERIVFFTGAGLSAECGLPTYRGAGGIWSEYNYEDFACQRAFDRDPEKVWDFHDERRRIMGEAEPGLAHRVIARLQQERAGTAIVTQNIDGLHQQAGATEVIELHGSVWRVRCRCPDGLQENHDQPIERQCPACSAYRRPDIVWFEDPMQEGPLRAAATAIAECDLLVSIGTSGVVYPAAALPQLARQTGAMCVEINPEETEVSGQYQVNLRMGASEALSSLWPEVAEMSR
ncbi:MAG: NAD-dependent deacylase [Planctomycetota bacterium]|nr:NAD-dependent deacylase [Planctomycetota bacterium]